MTPVDKELMAVKKDIDDLRALLEAIKSDTSQRWESFRDRLGDTYRQRLEQIRQGLQQVSTRTKEISEKAEQTVREHPFRAVLISIGAGWLVGRLWHSRR